MHEVGTQELCWFDATRDRKILATIWYPSACLTQRIFYRDYFPGFATLNAPILSGNYPLIIVSHGSGGHRHNQYYLAEYLTRHGYMVMAVEHPFDNVFNHTAAASLDNLLQRPKDISFALTQGLGFFDSHINASHITVMGHSFGGTTALFLLGAQHHENDLRDQRIRAGILMAPAKLELFSKASLQRMVNPIFLILAEKDELIDSKDYVSSLAAEYFLEIKEAGHYVFIASCPEVVKELSENDVSCFDTGVARESVHPLLKQEILYFLKSL